MLALIGQISQIMESIGFAIISLAVADRFHFGAGRRMPVSMVSSIA
jgi:hypothetical protein